MHTMYPRPSKPAPEFGYVYLRKYSTNAVYFDGLLLGYTRWQCDAHDFLDELVVGMYGAGDPRRFQLHRNLQTAKTAVARQNWRAKRWGYPGELTVEEWIGLICHFGGGCLRCGETSKIPVVDHVIPLSCGGPNLIVNVQPLCLSCNSHKSNKWTDYRDPAVLERFLHHYKR